jgi:DNA-binding winged helix-turn-helix (wHTH) protein/tetratricopeptide (TPR) repeat protein/TolB-like protein
MNMPAPSIDPTSESVSSTPNQPPRNLAQAAVYEFGPFRLDPGNRILAGQDGEIHLPGRAFDALCYLVQRPAVLLSKEEIMSAVWTGTFVEEANLTVAISTLRRALNDDSHDRQYIQTVARKGYRFVAKVRELGPFPGPQLPVLFAAASRHSIAKPAHSEDSASTRPKAVDRTRHWPIVALAAVLLLVLLGAGWKLLPSRTPIRSFAVLPFTAAHQANGSPDETTLLDLTDAFIAHLDNRLIVRPTSSVLRYATNIPVDAVAAGREQDVDAVLSGEVVQDAGHPSLRVRIVRVRDGHILWQNSFRGGNNLPQIEQDAAHATNDALHRLGAVTSPSPQPSATSIRLDDPAYQLYVRGRYFWNRRTVDGLRKSADYFRQSIDANPNYAPAYAGLADSYALLASFSVEPGSSANADARSAALSAIHLDPTLAEPHASLGMIYFFTDWNLLAAEREFEQAIRLNPNYATAHHWYALDLAAMGRLPEALYEIRLAQRLDPISLIIGTNVGWIEYLAKDYPAAASDLGKVLELDPDFARAHERLGLVQMATGDNAAAIANFQKALQLSGDSGPNAPKSSGNDPWVEGLLGDAEARAGDHAAAERVLSGLRRDATAHYVPPTSRALVLIGLGRTSEAISALSQAVDDHSTAMVYARVDPTLDPLRDDPAFQALLNRMKF